jgi:hypothetical protein
MELKFFINYRPLTGLFITTYRQPYGYMNEDVIGLAEDIASRRTGCCPLEGAKGALEDGSLLANIDQEIVEELYNHICEFESGERVYG